MKKTFRINNLLDFYETLLSERQRIVMEMYYREDYSLNEIAENLDISKQAVSDNLKRGVKKLEEFEENLSLLKKNEEDSILRKNLIKELNKLRLFSKEENFQSIIENMKSQLD